MPDEIDRAQDLEQAERARALAARRLAAAPALDSAPAERDCAVCGDPVALGRLKAVPLTHMCGPCAAAKEARR